MTHLPMYLIACCMMYSLCMEFTMADDDLMGRKVSLFDLKELTFESGKMAKRNLPLPQITCGSAAPCDRDETITCLCETGCLDSAMDFAYSGWTCKSNNQPFLSSMIGKWRCETVSKPLQLVPDVLVESCTIDYELSGGLMQLFYCFLGFAAFFLTCVAGCGLLKYVTDVRKGTARLPVFFKGTGSEILVNSSD